MSALIPTPGTIPDNINTPSPNTVKIKTTPLENNERNMDASELASLMLCLGFSLESFEKDFDAETQRLSLPDSAEGYLRIDITCTKSQMRATLLKEKNGCKCPSKEDASNAQFWNVSACSPSLPGNVTVSKCSLIPSLSADKYKLINTLLHKALDVVNVKDTNKKIENFTELLKTSEAIAHHKSLENLKSESFTAAATTSKNLLTTQNWEIQTSSPRDTSSPIPQKQEITLTLIEAMKTAQQALSDVIEIANIQNATFTKRVRRISDIKISPLASEDQKSTNSSCLNSTRPESSSSCRTPRKSKTPKKAVEKRKFLLPPSKLGVLRSRKSDSVIAGTSRSVNRKIDTSRSAVRDKSSKLSTSSLKLKTTPKNDSLLKLRIPTKIASISTNRTPK